MAKTINFANIAIGYDGSKLKAGTDMTRKDMADLQQILKQHAAPADVVKQKQEMLRIAFEKGAISAATYQRALKGVNDEFAKATTKPAPTFDQHLKTLGVVAAGYMAVRKASDFAFDSVKVAANVEKNRIAFQSLTGSLKEGSGISSEIIALSRNMGIQGSVASDAAKTMLQFGTASSMVVPTLRRIADITGGDAERIKMMSLAFGQASASGRLMGQDLLQMVNAGFNPLAEISRRTGVDLLTLKKQMEEGGISIEMVTRAFETATSEGGMFYQMLEKQKGSLAGQYNQLLADFEKMKQEIGTGLIPALSEAVGLTRDLMTVDFTGQKGNGMTDLLATTREIVKGLREGKSLAQSAAGAITSEARTKVFTDQYLRDNPLTKLSEEANKKLAALDPKQIELMKASKDKKAAEAYTKELAEIQKKIDEIRIGKTEAMRKELLASGMSKAQADQIAKLHEEHEALVENAKATKELANERRDLAKEMERLEDKAASLMEGMGKDAPVRALVKKLYELQEMLAYGVINDDMYEKLRKDAAKQSNSKSESMAASADYGSQEAYKILAGVANAQIVELQSQTALMEADKVIQEETRDAIKNLPAMRALR